MMGTKWNRWYYALPVLLWVTLNSCDDIIERDISNKEVVLIAPSNGVEIDSGEIVFLWDFVEGATEYELLVLSPDFDNPAIVHADTITSGNTFSTSLSTGTYTWGVRALNSVYATDFFINDLIVVEGEADPDISASLITYFSPADNAEIEEGNVVFFWDQLVNARRYRLQVVTPSFVAIQLIAFDTVTSLDQVNVFLDSGVYQWRILGINNSSRTDSAVTRSLIVE